MNAANFQSRFRVIRKKMPIDVQGALASVLGAKAFLETIRPISDSIKAEALAKFKPVVADEECGQIIGEVGRAITRWDDLFLALPEDAKKLYDYHKSNMADKGLVADGSLCPFLVAESMLREAKRVLFDVMEPYTGIANDHVHSLDKREEYLNLLLGLLVTCASEQGIELNILKR